MGFTRSIIFLVAVAVIASAGVAAAQDIEKRIGDKQDELTEIKQKIDEHRDKTKKLNKDEKSLLSQLADLEKEIDLQRAFLSNLQAQEQLMAEHIDSLRAEIEWRGESLAEQEAVFSGRIRQLYKRDPNYRWDILLGSANLEQAMNRFRFMKMIAEQDAVMIIDYRDRKSGLQRETASLTEALADMTMVRAEHEEERIKLEKIRPQREAMLSKIRGQKSEHAKAIKRLEESQQEVKNLLGRLETRRLEEKANPTVGKGDFARLKGSMMWPLEGTLKRKFGKVTHPKYNTVTFNNGIDIGAPEGTAIRAVAPATVEFVDWIDSYGKCIILNHGGAYYTLYAHVSSTFVTQGQQIDVGTVIAEIGDSGSLEGFECHFEVREGKKALDPLTWLAPARKRSS